MTSVTACAGNSFNSVSPDQSSSAVSISPSSFPYTAFSIEKPDWCWYKSHIYALQPVRLSPSVLDKSLVTSNSPVGDEVYSIKDSSVLEKIAYKASDGIYYSDGFYEGIYIGDDPFDWNGVSYTMYLPLSGGFKNSPRYAFPLPTTNAELGAPIGTSGDMTIYNPAKGANSNGTIWIIVTSHGYIFAAYTQTVKTSSQAK